MGNGEMTVREAGRKGGHTTSTIYGAEFYQQIGRLGGTVVRDTLGTEHYRQIGRTGGIAVRETRGRAFYAAIGEKGGNALLAKRGKTFFREIGRRGGQRKGTGRGNRTSRRGPGPRAKLTAAEVLDIRERCQAGAYQRDVATAFQVSVGTVSHIVTGRTWRWV